MCQFAEPEAQGGGRARWKTSGSGSGAAGRAGGRAASGAGREGPGRGRPPPSREHGGRARRMELNSLLMLLEAAEYLERRDREAEHGYASVLPFDGDFGRKKTKAAGLVRKAPNNRSSHNELEKHRRAKLRLYLEQLKQLVPLGPDSTRHTTLSLLKRAKKLEEQDRRALSIKEQLQREHRFLKRRLEQLSLQSVERVRTDSTGSAISTDDSEQEVDIEGMEFGPGELDSAGSSSDADDPCGLPSSGLGPPCRRGCPGLS
nr:max dimerization protein 4 isoform X2 [Dasypus novemcinctus]